MPGSQPAADYFTLFGLERGVEIDVARLTAKYLELQRQFHPDMNRGGAEQSAVLNEAYGVLKNRMRRLAHLLEVSGVSNFTAPQALLMEVMELREEHETSPADVEARVEKEIDALFAKAALDFKAGKLDDVANSYIKIKYLTNVIANP